MARSLEVAALLTEAEQQRVLEGLNSLRARPGLAPRGVRTPPPEWACHDAAGAAEAALSDRYQRFSSDNIHNFPSRSALESLLLDADLAGLGHRRWMLDPFLGSIAWGRADGQPPGSAGMTMVGVLALVDPGNRPLDADGPGFVAMPQGRHPLTLFPPSGVLSLSIVADPASRAANTGRVDFSTAVVRVSDASGAELAHTNRLEDYRGAGLPNLLSWQVRGLRVGIEYQVRVGGARVDGIVRDLDYVFELQ